MLNSASKPHRRIAFLLLFSTLAALLSMAQQQGPILRGTITPPVPSAIDSGRRVIAVIGITEYDNWLRLPSANPDAREVRDTLVRDFGFTELVPALLDKQATKPAIEHFVADLLSAALKPDDEVILFFGGHGTTRKDKVGDDVIETGYLVPVNAQASDGKNWSEYVEIDPFLDLAARLPARHVLVILDSCHSGIALSPAVHRTDNRWTAELAAKFSRQVVTSAQADQNARDDGPNGHSMFTGAFLRGLKTGAIDRDRNGLVTASEMAVYLQSQVGGATGSQQTPAFGTFSKLDKAGEFVLPIATAGATAVAAPPIETVRTAPAFQQRVAVVVGLNNYRESELTSLQFAEPDAELMTTALSNMGYVVKTATSPKSKPAPTLGQLKRTLVEAGAMLDPENGTLLFYYSGHGYDFNGASYLATYDASIKKDMPGWKLDDLIDRLGDSQAHNRILLLDACRSGVAAPPKPGLGFFGVERTLPEIQSLPIERARSRGVTILYATQPGGASMESTQVRHGLFTYAVVDALRSSGALTIRQLADSVREKVKKLSQGQQVPSLYVHPDDEGIVIASH